MTAVGSLSQRRREEALKQVGEEGENEEEEEEEGACEGQGGGMQATP